MTPKPKQPKQVDVAEVLEESADKLPNRRFDKNGDPIDSESTDDDRVDRKTSKR